MPLSEIRQNLENEIQNLHFGESPTELYEPLRYLMKLGGKRMRPFLTILTYYAFRNDWKRIVRPALAVEVFHNFSLMHDDLMDNAPLRRNQATIHEKWNANTAILSGDVMLVEAYKLLEEIENPYFLPIFKLFNQTAKEVCEGQQFDMDFEKLASVSEAQYLEMIRLKTAVLLGFSLQMGAILAGADQENQDLFYELGIQMGIGFQLKDDLLDVYGEPDKFGKQVGGDIVENKKTFLLIKALENATGETKKKLDFWLKQRHFDKAEKVQAVTEVYNQLNIKVLTEQKMHNYFDQAAQTLSRIRLEAEKKHLLKSFLGALMERES